MRLVMRLDYWTIFLFQMVSINKDGIKRNGATTPVTRHLPTDSLRHGTGAPRETPLRARMRGQAQRRPKQPVLWPPGAEAADFPNSEQTLTCEAMEFAH